MANDNTFPPQCWGCFRQPPKLAALAVPRSLKKCKGCLKAEYCSQECQKNNWHEHQWICSETSKRKAVAGTGLLNSLLHGHSEAKAMGHLIDSFRMRVEDEYVFWGELSGLYAQESPIPEFNRYIKLCESRPGLLPEWWTPEKRGECKQLAQDRNGQHCIYFAVEKPDIQDLYDDSMMPMKLRLLAERIIQKSLQPSFHPSQQRMNGQL